MRDLKSIACLLLSLSVCAAASGQEPNIYRLVVDGDRAGLEKLLAEKPLLVNAPDTAGRTPLFFAVQTRNVALARWLIDRGAAVRVGDLNLRAPLHFANWAGDTAMIDLLLEKGAVVDTRAIGGATPLIHASLNDRADMGRYLLGKGADIDIQCNSLTTPLYFAALNDNLEYARFLLESGADVDVPDFVGRTPFAVAVRDGHAAMAALLADHGADVFQKDEHFDRSMLHVAAIEGHDDVVDLLIGRGLGVREKDRSGATALDYARRYGHRSTADLLVKNGTIGIPATAADSGPGTAWPARPDGEARIMKLQNGSWGIDTRSGLFVFGYAEIGASPSARSFANGHLAPEELPPGRKVYYFDHGFHPVRGIAAMTGSNPVYTLAESGANIAFVLNEANRGMYSSLKLREAHFPKLGETAEIDGFRVTVLPSYGNHRAWILEVDGLTIVWLTGICDNYLTHRRDAKVVDELAAREVRPDILLLGNPEGIGPELGHGVRETYLEARRLSPRACFAFGKEPEERRIARQIVRRLGSAPEWHVAGNPGDIFLFKNGAIR